MPVLLKLETSQNEERLRTYSYTQIVTVPPRLLYPWLTWSEWSPQLTHSVVLYWLWWHLGSAFALHPLCVWRKQKLMISDPLTLFFGHWCFISYAVMHVLMQGATNVGLWTQPGPNPVRYNLLPVYEALFDGHTVLFFLLLCLCTAFLSSLPPPTRGWPQNSQALNMPVHPSVCSVCTVW